jgi:hypothetical protein
VKLRRHQEEARAIARDIANGVRDEKTVVAFVTPGGGKTLMASLFAHELLATRDVEQVLVVTPRSSLREQMRDGFRVPELGLQAGLSSAKKPGQSSLLKAERAGFVTTYQNLASKPKQWLNWVKKNKVLVILDEGHHLPGGMYSEPQEAGDDEARWTAEIRPIVDAAKRVLVMTGSIARANASEPIAFVTYEDRKPVTLIRYPRRDALGEHAIIQVSVQLCDGEARSWQRFGANTKRLSAVSARDESAVRSILLNDSGYRDAMVGNAICAWEDYRENRGHRSRMVVICHNVKACREVVRHIRDKYPKWQPVLAVGDEPSAHRALAKFRDKKDGDILVTCQMAYEGLDVPDITHLVCLTDKRSRPWLEQALSRATRFDKECKLPWEEQWAFIYVPDEPAMVKFISEWIDEQPSDLEDAPDGNGIVVRPNRRRGPITGEGAFGEIRYADTYGIFSEPDNRRIRRAKDEFPQLSTLGNAHILEVARRLYPNDAELMEVG